jgi:hypothetical protein
VTTDTLYLVVYDVASRGFHLEWAWFSPLLVTVAALVRFRFADSTAQRLVGAVVAVAAAAFTVFEVQGNYTAFRELRRALQDGDYTLVQGPVEDFVPGRLDGHQNERFRVGSHRFEYSPYLGLTGFRQLRAAGGAVHEGVRVRIFDVNGTIARLDTVAGSRLDLPPNVR